MPITKEHGSCTGTEMKSVLLLNASFCFGKA
jgi:hypothetical protein